MTITLQEVKSNQIEAIGYDAATLTLAIRFKGGTLYHYSEVPPKLFDELQAAESVGAFFGKHIKPHADLYPYTKQSAKVADDVDTSSTNQGD